MYDMLADYSNQQQPERYKSITYMRLDSFPVVKTNAMAFWFMALHSVVGGYHHFEEIYRIMRTGVGVRLAVDSQSTSKSGYQASFWDP
jgi:hypothetical protein